MPGAPGWSGRPLPSATVRCMVKFSGLPDPLEPRRLRERALPFVLLFAFALILRLAAVWIGAGADARPAHGTALLEQAAWSLANGHGLATGEGFERTTTTAVPPLAPWLASLVYRVTGREPLAALLAQAALAAFVPLLLARLSAPLFGGAIGFAAGIVAAADPVLLAACGTLRAETVFTLAMLWGMIVSIEWVRRPGARRAFWAGAAFGVAALAHPAALALPFVTMAWARVPLGLMLEPRAVRRQMLLLAGGLAVVVAPWMLRNLFVAGVIAPVTSGMPPVGDPGAPGVWLPWWAALAPPALWGIVRVLRGARRIFLSYPLVMVGVLAVAALALWGSFIARLPIEPLVVLFAAAGGEDVWRRWRTRRTASAA